MGRGLFRDVRQSARVLSRSPAFTLLAAVVLALAIGATSAVVSVLDTLLPAPKGAERLVRLHATSGESGRFDVFSFPNFLDLRERSRTLVELTAHQSVRVSLGLGAEAENAEGELVTGGYFRLIGAEARIGRALAPEDDLRPGGHPVLVLSDRLWKRSLGGTPEGIGRNVHVNGRPFTVVGVMPEGFRGTYAALSADFWAPMMMYAEVRPRGVAITERGWGWLTGTGRLAPGVSLLEARAELTELSRHLREEHPDVNREIGFEIFPARALPEAYHEAASRILAFFLAASGLLLLVACANVAAVLLARVIERKAEDAVRSCLGASRLQLVRRWAIEAAMLAILGACPALLLAAWFRSAAPRFLPPQLGLAPFPAIDARLLVLTSIVALLAVILLASVPAVRAARADLRGRLTAAGGRSRAFTFLLAAQVAASLVLLVVAGLLSRSLRQIALFDPGFRPEGVFLATVDLSRHGYGEAEGKAFYEELQERLRAFPGRPLRHPRRRRAAWVQPRSHGPSHRGPGPSGRTAGDTRRLQRRGLGVLRNHGDCSPSRTGLRGARGGASRHRERSHGAPLLARRDRAGKDPRDGKR